MGLGIGAIIAAAILLWYTSQVLLLFFAAVFFAVFFSGLARLLERFTPLGYTACVAITLLGLVLLLVAAGSLVGPAVADQ
jgi:predicted PurR-regulated permease PerM